MPYDGEPEKMHYIWKPNFGEYDYSQEYRKAAHTLKKGELDPQKAEELITRMCEISAISDSVDCKIDLAIIAGVELSEIDIFKRVIGVNIERQDTATTMTIAEKLRRLHDDGNEMRFNALSAAIGFYPLKPFDIECILLNDLMPDESGHRKPPYTMSSNNAPTPRLHNSG